MARHFLLLGAFFALISVAAGAMGSHLLSSRLTSDRLEIFEIAVRYQIYHALGLLLLGTLSLQAPSGLLAWSGWAFVAGILLFSGSLYILSLAEVRGLGMITPIGGLCLLAGWALMAVGVWKSL